MNCKSCVCRRNRARRAVSPNGFTLMELLIVMAIIADPFSDGHRQHQRVYEASECLVRSQFAAEDCRGARYMYEEYVSREWICVHAQALGGDPHSGAPTPTSAQLLPADLASGFKQGYEFTIAMRRKGDGQQRGPLQRLHPDGEVPKQWARPATVATALTRSTADQVRSHRRHELHAASANEAFRTSEAERRALYWPPCCFLPPALPAAHGIGQSSFARMSWRSASTTTTTSCTR